MEGFLEMNGYNTTEVYEAMQRYRSAQAHASQTYQTPLQKHVGRVRVPNFFQLPLGTLILLLPPLIMNICANNLNRKATEEIADEECHILRL